MWRINYRGDVGVLYWAALPPKSLCQSDIQSVNILCYEIKKKNNNFVQIYNYFQKDVCITLLIASFVVCVSGCLNFYVKGLYLPLTKRNYRTFVYIKFSKAFDFGYVYTYIHHKTSYSAVIEIPIKYDYLSNL